MMDNFESVRLFVAVVQSGSFSATARKKNTTPSSITRKIASLEEQLGVRLLNRTTRSMELSEAGRVYYRRAINLVREYDEMNLEVSDLEATPRGLLRVSASFSLGTTRLATILPEFLDKYPEVKVELALTDRVVDFVDDRVDVAIRISRQLPDSSLIARKLFRYQRVICASPDYLAKKPAPQKPSDLTDHECLTFLAGGVVDMGRPGEKSWTFSRAGRKETVAVNGRMDANSLNALVSAALNGFGLFLAPRWLIEDHLVNGRLEVVLGEYDVDPNDRETWVYAVYASNRFLSPKVRAFIDFVADKFAH